LLLAVVTRPAAANLVDDCYQVGPADPDRLITVCTRAIEAGGSAKDRSVAYDNRARGYQAKGDFDRALADYNESIRLDPRNAYAYDNRGDLYRENGEYERAISDYSAAIRVDGTFLSAYLDRGMAYEAMGNLRSARADYQTVLDSAGRNREIDRWAKKQAKARLDELGE